jgi:hypothetical protein
MTTRDVPGFPENDPKLMNVKNWPKKRRIEGWDCELKVVSAIVDFNRQPKRASFSRTTSAFYVCHHRWLPWRKQEMRGPHFTWASDGQLLERAYTHSRKDMLVYHVDRSGRLAGFEDRKHGVTEYFDADGVLIAGEYKPVNLDWKSEGYRGGTVSVWLGDRITHNEFLRRRVRLFRDMASRY